MIRLVGREVPGGARLGRLSTRLEVVDEYDTLAPARSTGSDAVASTVTLIC